ncbi:MAG: rhodanese-like domain-containing protein [Methylobacteriaceae bacterium]|nr:rhodanese-like domain-containing protein [Methylobacteriaceae bacterium]
MGRLFAQPAGDEVVDFETFRDLVRTGAAAIVDVREPHEFASGHVEGATNLPLSRFDPADLPTDRPVVLMCLSGARSAQAQSIARGAGRADVRNYRESLNGWRARGGRLVV